MKVWELVHIVSICLFLLMWYLLDLFFVSHFITAGRLVWLVGIPTTVLLGWWPYTWRWRRIPRSGFLGFSLILWVSLLIGIFILVSGDPIIYAGLVWLVPPLIFCLLIPVPFVVVKFATSSDFGYRELSSFRRRIIPKSSVSRRRVEKPTGRASRVFRDMEESVSDGSEPPCVICRKPLVKGEDILTCTHCAGSGHKSEMLVWLEREGTCPMCRRTR